MSNKVVESLPFDINGNQKFVVTCNPGKPHEIEQRWATPGKHGAHHSGQDPKAFDNAQHMMDRGCVRIRIAFF